MPEVIQFGYIKLESLSHLDSRDQRVSQMYYLSLSYSLRIIFCLLRKLSKEEFWLLFGLDSLFKTLLILEDHNTEICC